MLLLPRQHAHALVHEVSVQVSAGGVSLQQLVEENRRRGNERAASSNCSIPACSHENRYFDVFVEYAKADVRRHPDPDHGREPRARSGASCDLLPTLWFRNTWSWGKDDAASRHCAQVPGRASNWTSRSMGNRWLYCEGAPELLFTENETNSQRLFGVDEPLART